MANLLLKKGLYKDFKTKVLDAKQVVEGALYFTEDEGGLYLGKSKDSVVRIQGTVHQYDTLKDFTSEITPPYSKDVIYFIADKDALVRWNGTTWVQLNTTAVKAKEMSDAIATNSGLISGLTENLNNLTKTVGDNKTKIDNTISDINDRLTKAGQDIALKASQADLDILEGIVEGHGQIIGNIETTYVKQVDFNKTVREINGEIDGIKEALGLDDTSAEGTIIDRITTLEKDNEDNKWSILTNASGIQDLKDILNDDETGLGATIDKVTALENTLNDDETGLGATINKVTALENTLNNDETGLSSRLTKAESTIADHATQLSGITEILDKTATKEELTSLGEALQKEIDSDILAANAMTYKKGIGSEAELILENPSVGDTYVITSAFTREIDDEVVTYQPGDLLIATSSNTEQPEDENGKIKEEELVWVHVATGYSSVHNPKLSVDDNSIILNDFAGNSLGLVKLNSNSKENITIESDTENNIINITLTWDSF